MWCARVAALNSSLDLRPLAHACALIAYRLIHSLTCDLSVDHLVFADQSFIIITMSYAAGIIAAITGLKDRTGSSSIAIKKTMQASMPKDKKWMNATFLAALKKMVADGVLVQNKGSYKLGAKAKKAPKKKAAAPKKSAPKKKSVRRRRRLRRSRHPRRRQ
jgi:hypothetical protein